jgi:hypothetical protein
MASEKQTQATKRAEDPKVRIRRDLYEKISTLANKSPRGAGVNTTSIAEAAVEQWLVAHRDVRPGAVLVVGDVQMKHPGEVGAPPKNEEEAVLASAVVLLLRDKSASAKTIVGVVHDLLANWIDKARALRAKERSA